VWRRKCHRFHRYDRAVHRSSLYLRVLYSGNRLARYLPIGSSSPSLWACASCKTATAVNILFIEPMRKRVWRVLGTRCSRSESPYASSKKGFPSFATRISPENLPAAVWSSSRFRKAATSSASVPRDGKEFGGRGGAWAAEWMGTETARQRSRKTREIPHEIQFEPI